MKSKLNLSLSGKLYLLIAAFALGLTLFGAISYSTIANVKIHGPQYEGLVLDKDALADVLPPPQFIVESYLTSLLMRDAKTKEDLQQLIDKFGKLKTDFLERQTFWREHMDDQ